jgi:hypothetical protein
LAKYSFSQKGVEGMNKLMYALVIFSILSFGFAANSLAGSMAQNGLTIYDGTKLVGAVVKAPDGVELGRIFDFVITTQGNVDFAIVNQVPPPGFDFYGGGGHIVAVPFSDLKILKGKSQELQVVFNGDKEKFYKAPEAPLSFFHNGGQVNLQKVAELDRYFGVRPSWTSPY